jgi:hypothetical protein
VIDAAENDFLLKRVAAHDQEGRGEEDETFGTDFAKGLGQREEMYAMDAIRGAPARAANWIPFSASLSLH